MSTQVTPAWGVRPHKRRGLKRVIFHIIFFGLLGALALILGLIGTSKLNALTRKQMIPVRAEAIYTSVEASFKDLALAQIPADNKSAASSLNNKVLSAQRKTLKTYVSDQLQLENAPAEETVIHAVVDKMLDKADSVMDAALAAAIRTAAKDGMDGLLNSAVAAADAASQSLNSDTVKANMNPANTDSYTLMYFSTPLVIIGAVCLVFSLLLIILWFTRDEIGRAAVGNLLEPFDYLLPFLVGVGVFTLYPMVRVLIMSFQENYAIGKNGGGTFSGWGFGNYQFILSGAASDQFLRSLSNTALYVAFTVPIGVCLAIVIAYLLNQKHKLNALFQTAYFLPMVTTATAVGLVWRWMFNRDFGLINSMLGFISQFFGAPQNINWLQTGGTNHAIGMTVLIVFGIWNTLPMTIILLLSGLQNIDDHLYTVARVDGSGPMRIFFKITVPLLSPTIGLVLIINSISAFKVYTDVFVLWNGTPENYQMETVAWFIYNNISGNDGLHYTGLAAASAMVLFVIIFVFTMVQKFIQRKWVYQ